MGERFAPLQRGLAPLYRFDKPVFFLEVTRHHILNSFIQITAILGRSAPQSRLQVGGEMNFHVPNIRENPLPGNDATPELAAYSVGSPPGDGSLIAAERNFIADLQTRALALKAQGVSVDDAGKQLSAEFKTKYPDWPSMNVVGFVRSIYAE